MFEPDFTLKSVAWRPAPDLTAGAVGWARDVHVGGTQGGGPALAQVVEVRLARLDPVTQLSLAGVAPYYQHVDRHADAEVRAHGGIHRDQADFQGVIKIDAVGHGAVEHRL